MDDTGQTLADLTKRAEQPDRLFGREVFDRLREALDLEVHQGSDGRLTIVAAADEYVAPNYEIRSDGVYLKHGQALDSLDWLPACAFDGTGAPDPLTAPALPLPFTARHLAAFVLGGWGWFLGQSLGMPYNEINDEEAVGHLSGQRDRAAREAVLMARKALMQARALVANTDPAWENAKRDFDAAQVQCAKHKTPPDKLRAALAGAHRAMREAEPAWRTAMVLALLPQRGPAPEEKPEAAATAAARSKHEVLHAAEVRHRENRKVRQAAINDYVANHSSFRTKEEAANKLGEKYARSHDTVRSWLKGVKVEDDPGRTQGEPSERPASQ